MTVPAVVPVGVIVIVTAAAMPASACNGVADGASSTSPCFDLDPVT